jgi:rhamnogalacturonan acetylesterase
MPRMNRKCCAFAIVCLVATLAVGQSEPARTDPALPTLWIIGDSTVHNSSGSLRGWGDVIDSLFDTSRINIINRARGGRSSRTFITDGLWDDVLKNAKRGDFVIMQFGHNDGGPIVGDNRERGSLPGIGDESKDVTLTLEPRKGQVETVHTYGWYMKKMIDDAKASGITPIVCSPVPRLPKATVPANAPATQPTSYNLWAQQVAQSEGIGFIDLNTLVLAHYSGMTPEELKEKYFTPADNTHFNAEGAMLNARCVVEGLKMLPDCPLNAFLKKD